MPRHSKRRAGGRNRAEMRANLFFKKNKGTLGGGVVPAREHLQVWRKRGGKKKAEKEKVLCKAAKRRKKKKCNKTLFLEQKSRGSTKAASQQKKGGVKEGRALWQMSPRGRQEIPKKKKKEKKKRAGRRHTLETARNRKKNR